MNKGTNLKIKVPSYDNNEIQNIHRHIDYLRLSSTGYHVRFGEIMQKIDDDNSNQYYDDTYTYTKLYLSMGACLQIAVVREGRAVPIMLYNEFDEKTKKITKRNSRVDFYGSFFRIYELKKEKYNDYIQDIVEGYTTDATIYISRVDVAVDVFLKKQQYIPPIEEICRTDIDRFGYRPYYARGGRLISCEVGDPDTLGVFARVYHKTIELLSKGKGFLYRDYLTFGGVHRYEVQLGSRYLKNLPVKELEGLIIEVGLYLTNGLGYTGNISGFYEYKEPSKDRIKVDAYAKDIVGRAATYASNGYNPYMLLVEWLPTKISLAMNEEYIREFLLFIRKKKKLKNNKQKMTAVTKKT